MDRTASALLTFIVTPGAAHLFAHLQMPAGHTMTIDHTGRAPPAPGGTAGPIRASALTSAISANRSRPS